MDGMRTAKSGTRAFRNAKIFNLASFDEFSHRSHCLFDRRLRIRTGYNPSSTTFKSYDEKHTDASSTDQHASHVLPIFRMISRMLWRRTPSFHQ